MRKTPPDPPIRAARHDGTDRAVSAVRARANVLRGDPAQYDRLIDEIDDARLVLLGEATHGTHEFYRERAFITRRLIAEKGFAAVVVEADWPDAYRVNRFVRGQGADQDAVSALGDFGRFPTWMWRNADVLDFIGWLRTFNDGRRPEDRAGFYGMDLYSLRASMEAVLRYLDKVDPDGAARARRRYGCFDQFGEELQGYGYAAGVGLHPSCERDVIAQLLDLHRRRVAYASRDGRVAPDEFFYAEQNARLVRDAEAYYRAMFGGRAESWNVRDHHMVDTVGELRRFLDAQRPAARLVLWAHNSHLGDASATDMAAAGEVNVGQLVRNRFGGEAVLVGFTTYDGTVTAAREWDGDAGRRHVRPALAGSYERLFHDAGLDRALLPLRTDADLAATLTRERLERAIGVLYVPETERQSHYFHASLTRQFDYVIHVDTTRAVEPLERTALWEAGEVAETYPSGL
ncbi:MAG: erythromycin esterase family protein [Vicinamibacterales bacterium]